MKYVYAALSNGSKFLKYESSGRMREWSLRCVSREGGVSCTEHIGKQAPCSLGGWVTDRAHRKRTPPLHFISFPPSLGVLSLVAQN